MDKALLHKYFRGEASKEEERLIMDWADSSEANRAEYLEERKMWNALLVHWNELNNRTKARVNTTFLTFNKIAGIAAMFALVLAFSWIYLNSGQKESKLSAVVVPPGQRVQLILEDGTKVWLNSSSTFTYPTTFNSKLRVVQLDGEGYFEVAHNAAKPFIVKTKKYNIRVLGTTFNVFAYSKRTKDFEASLIKGSIDVSLRSDIGRKHFFLKSSESVVEINGLLQKQTISNYDRFRWKDGLICLDDVPFDELMRRFAVYYDIQINIENPKVYSYRCTGKFRQSDGIEYALRVIQKDLKFRFIRDDDNNVITIK